jgi:hypothetical protein
MNQLVWHLAAEWVLNLRKPRASALNGRAGSGAIQDVQAHFADENLSIVTTVREVALTWFGFDLQIQTDKSRQL